MHRMELELVFQGKQHLRMTLSMNDDQEDK